MTPTAGTPAYDLAYSYRWLLTSVTDTNGNTVIYNYSCPASPVCYSDSVVYNGNVVKFYYETRPDMILMGNGRDISETSRRIKTIGVLVNGAVRGAYKLTYDQAPFSNTSRLTQVTRFGTDATGTADGTITGGTSKVIAQMTYQNTDGVYSTVTSDIYNQPLVWGDFAANKPNEVGDLDFDGRDEIFGNYVESKQVRTDRGEFTTYYRAYKRIIKFFGNAASYDIKSLFMGPTSPSTDPYSPATSEFIDYGAGRFLATKNTVDFPVSLFSTQSTYNGNKGTTSYKYTASSSLILSDPQLALTSANCLPSPPAGYEAVCAALPSYSDVVTRLPGPSFVADTNGDGLDTLEFVTPGGNAPKMLGIGDFLGNGHQQPAFWANGGIQKSVLVSGKWQPTGSTFGAGCPNDTQGGICAFADVNGDGASDLVSFNPGSSTIAIWLSTGTGFKFYSVPSLSGASLVLRDFDNDGRMDAITIAGNEVRQPQRVAGVKIYSLQPSSTAITPVEFALPVALNASSVVGDFNGDGLPDFTDYSHMFISNAGTGNPNLLKQITTELGGTVAAEYSPSSTWTNNYLPQLVHAVTKLSVSDGRGQTAVSSYQYAGGKYDPAARKFLGFASIVETKPLANGETAPSTVTTTYRQDLASYGLPSLTVWKDGAGTVHKQVAETYAVNTASKPYTVQNTATDTTFIENVTYTLRVERGFDAYNNVVSLKDYGRTDASGDETWTERFFSPNTSAYIVSALIAERTHAGLTSTDPCRLQAQLL
ncbi:toxin TcdB middle/N-terminal domain-containing protein [Mesorhizobium sp. B2-4-19]|uniref:toxin TcdB middle/N-terminal domain-containing protein n=1 Tax=Mesorhizobium sp. B2-4-19 TaxID=2589930 RepID=UPI0015E44944|nr:toxin TcdB middle/N-terminal domain-containing protein [Mesorhizobium sp. B2-4-19]